MPPFPSDEDHSLESIGQSQGSLQRRGINRGMTRMTHILAVHLGWGKAEKKEEVTLLCEIPIYTVSSSLFSLTLFPLVALSPQLL